MSLPRSATYKSELRPLPMRVTQLQFERLKEARNRDGLSVQEHVRRALDVYLAKVERDFAAKEMDTTERDHHISRPAPRPNPRGIAEALASPTIGSLKSRQPVSRNPAPLVRTK